MTDHFTDAPAPVSTEGKGVTRQVSATDVSRRREPSVPPLSKIPPASSLDADSSASSSRGRGASATQRAEGTDGQAGGGDSLASAGHRSRWRFEIEIELDEDDREKARTLARRLSMCTPAFTGAPPAKVRVLREAAKPWLFTEVIDF